MNSSNDFSDNTVLLLMVVAILIIPAVVTFFVYTDGFKAGVVVTGGLMVVLAFVVGFSQVELKIQILILLAGLGFASVPLGFEWREERRHRW